MQADKHKLCGNLFRLTLISIVVYVSDGSNAFSKVCIEGIVTAQNTVLLHHPLKTAAAKAYYIYIYVLCIELAEDKSRSYTSALKI